MAKVKAKASGKVSVKVKKKPIKAGSTHTNDTGGIFTAKVAAIARKRRNKQKKQ